MPGHSSGRHTKTFSPVVTSERKQELNNFQRNAGLKFRKYDLLNLSMCHRSFVNESADNLHSNERLEFLGDSILGLVIADYLYRELPDRPEGDLAKIKAHVVSERILADIALSIGIDKIVYVGRGEDNTGGRRKKSLMSDCLEALIGASFLDAGFARTADFILRHFKSSIETVLEGKHDKDYKTLLQEHVQKRYRTYPKYTLDKITGPDHERTYWMMVTVGNDNFGPGSGKNKKSAEQAAASLAYNKLNSSP